MNTIETIRLILESPKKIKADYVAWLLDIGANDYSDSCEWKPQLHKYRFSSHYDGEEKVLYLSQKHLAGLFDIYLEAFGDEEFARWYEEERLA